MNILSIPPFLSASILFILFILGLFKIRESKRNMLFSFLCLLGFFLNFDKMLLTIVKDESLALRISRIDHLFLVFVIPLYFHFTLSFTGHRGWKNLLKALYCASIILLPLTQSPHYLKGVRKYFFGFFAQAGPLFFFFISLSLFSIVFSIFLLFKKLKEEKSSIERLRIKYLLMSFGIAAVMSHFDILVMIGYKLYPFGNFIFVPLVFIAYALYRFDIMDWKVFLNKTVNFTLLFLLTLSIFAGVHIFSKSFLFPSLSEEIADLIAISVALFFFYFIARKIERIVMNFFEQKNRRKIEAIKDLSYEILMLDNIEEIKEKVEKGLTELMELHKCEIRLSEERIGEKSPRFIKEEDGLFLSGYRLFFPLNSKHFPGYLLLGEKKSMEIYRPDEISVLSILANHIALSFDNAFNYKKLRDLTLSLERKVEERTRALIKSESLAAVGKLAAGVAHELNNPLTSVMSTIEYSLDRLEKGHYLYEDLQFSLKELKRAKGIIESLLDTSRQKERDKIPLDLHRPIEDALRILYNQYKHRNIRIEKRYEAKKSLILGDLSRLCQVFINLLKNALDAIEEKKGVILIQTMDEKEEAIVKIKDNGIGIEKGLINDIFKPFFTTKPPGEGLGLGLFIVHEIIEEHGGRIEVKSEKGKGTEFILFFPLYQQ